MARMTGIQEGKAWRPLRIQIGDDLVDRPFPPVAVRIEEFEVRVRIIHGFVARLILMVRGRLPVADEVKNVRTQILQLLAQTLARRAAQHLPEYLAPRVTQGILDALDFPFRLDSLVP